MTVFYIILGLIALFVILTLLAPKNYLVERRIIVNRSLAETYQYLKLFKNQDYWSPWKKRDPNMKQTHSGVDGSIGYISKWESDHKQVGSGEQEITKLVENKEIESEIRFLRPFKSTSTGFFLLKEIEPGKTEIIWGFKGNHKAPMNVMMLMYNMDKAVGKDFDEGLSELKVQLEK